MIILLKKEINEFFSTITGYIVVLVFLLAVGLFMWVFPGQHNVLDSGYASLDTLFTLAPWIFLFLVPAVTMRMVAEEKKSGTMELLMTRPISDLQIVVSKYLAALILVVIALIPTLIYFYSVYQLGNPVGNVDIAGTVGSYIGLFFLAAIYVSIGIFASSLTGNQIIAFIIAVLISYFFYMGFDFLSEMWIFGGIDTFIVDLGINAHYKSMSRGVIDTRDVVYFLSVIVVFIFLTKTIIQNRK
ncbi:MAG: gliding motility-associated ABC transporter permease subunit GldF [Bacteroidales bacterium]|nr:gliding motility-associated ABC transporter permease subunit GldF [Bacteroidales bacterium]